MSEHRLILNKRLDRVLAEGHPWIFRDALTGEFPPAGEVVEVFSSEGRLVARGLSEDGPIGVRVFCNRDVPVDQTLFTRRIQAAAALRRRVVPPSTTAYRLLHGEGDRLPGVVCDVYGEHAVLQFDGKAIPVWQDVVLAALTPVVKGLGVGHLLLRSGRRQKRTIEAVFGSLPEGPIQVLEHGMFLSADLVDGQKTGLFLDHRESRKRVRELAGGLRVLNLYGYTGGFSIAAGLGGAAFVETVDQSKGACAFADQGWLDNGLADGLHRSFATKVQPFLQQAAEQSESYGLIVSDPPSFAPSESKVNSAIAAYSSLHRSALSRLQSGGLYLAASCSSHVGRTLFEKTIRDAARKDRRVIQVLERWGAPADHPRLAAFPEGDYLTVLLVRVVD